MSGATRDHAWVREPGVGAIHQISTSQGGVPKLPVPEAYVGTLGVEGDGHAYAEHGGPNRALCLYSLERIDALRSEGHEISPGSTGENLTLSGIDWDLVRPGTRVHLGETVIAEVTEFTAPCRKIARSFTNGEIDRIDQSVHPGWARAYARVVQEGRIRVGDSARVNPALEEDLC